MRRATALSASLLAFASFASAAAAQDEPFTGIAVNCWRDFPVQVNTMNKPFGDRRDGSCPLRQDWARLAEGFTTGYAEGTFSVPAGLCVDFTFLIQNDGSDGGTIVFTVDGEEIGRVAGSGPRPSDRCEAVTFPDVHGGDGELTVRITFEELVPGRIHHNGAIRMGITPSADETRSLAIDGVPTKGARLTASVVGDPDCDPGRRYLVAVAPTADFGHSYPDDTGREFPLDDPIVVDRGRFDGSAFASVSLKLPNNPAYVGRTFFYAWLPFEKLPDGEKYFGTASNVVAITILP